MTTNELHSIPRHELSSGKLIHFKIQKIFSILLRTNDQVMHSHNKHKNRINIMIY